jgi:hypothetical protein
MSEIICEDGYTSWQVSNLPFYTDDKLIACTNINTTPQSEADASRFICGTLQGPRMGIDA